MRSSNRECHYWLRLLRDGSVLPRDAVDPLIHDCDELARMLTSIVKTTRMRTNPIQNSKSKVQNCIL
jgi:four helix bundle protein